MEHQGDYLALRLPLEEIVGVSPAVGNVDVSPGKGTVGVSPGRGNVGGSLGQG